jgi:hypothetical protein
MGIAALSSSDHLNASDSAKKDTPKSISNIGNS